MVNLNPPLIARLQKIKLIISDVDGVLTDGTLYYGIDGEAEVIKGFHARDGLGIKLLHSAGINFAVVSGRDSQPLRARLNDLQVTSFQLGKLDKESACLKIMADFGVTPEETVFVGDDSIDLPAFAVCGMAVAVADAMPYVREQADLVLSTNGGKGALRELVDLILQCQNKDIHKTPQGFLSKAHTMKQ